MKRLALFAVVLVLATAAFAQEGPVPKGVPELEPRLGHHDGKSWFRPGAE